MAQVRKRFIYCDEYVHHYCSHIEALAKKEAAYWTGKWNEFATFSVYPGLALKREAQLSCAERECNLFWRRNNLVIINILCMIFCLGLEYKMPTTKKGRANKNALNMEPSGTSTGDSFGFATTTLAHRCFFIVE